MAEKTEKATPKKLRDARKKGQVAKSQDFPSAFTFVLAISAVLASSGYLYSKLGGFITTCFRSISAELDMNNEAPSLIFEAVKTITLCSFPIMIIVALVGMLINFLIVGPVFSSEAIKFDLKRLNPVDNIKNKFKFKTLFELLKSIFKIAGAVLIIYFVLRNSLEEILATVQMPVLGSAVVFSHFLTKVVINVGIFFLAVAVADLAFQKKNFAKEMKMEKFEVKQEFKDTEGDPQIKGKRKQLAQELAYQEGPQVARRARAVVTNPTHIAVALGYNEQVHNAPIILTMGAGIMADAIIKQAVAFNVPVMRNVDLAHTLFELGEVSEYIPEETFEAIAEILRWIESMEVEQVSR